MSKFWKVFTGVKPTTACSEASSITSEPSVTPSRGDYYIWIIFGIKTKSCWGTLVDLSWLISILYYYWQKYGLFEIDYIHFLYWKDVFQKGFKGYKVLAYACRSQAEILPWTIELTHLISEAWVDSDCKWECFPEWPQELKTVVCDASHITSFYMPLVKI